MKLFNFYDVSDAVNRSAGPGKRANTYANQLRHLAAEGVFEIAARDGPGARATQLLDAHEASLAALQVYLLNTLGFDVHQLRAVADSARSPRLRLPCAFDDTPACGKLEEALDGIEAGERWLIVLLFASRRNALVHFCRLGAVPANPGGVLQITVEVTDLFRPFLESEIA